MRAPKLPDSFHGGSFFTSVKIGSKVISIAILAMHGCKCIRVKITYVDIVYVRIPRARGHDCALGDSMVW